MQRADKRKYHYIYKITRNDGRFYIGMHSTDNLDDGYFGSGKLISRSIKKHGVEKHSKEILEFLPSRDLLKDREKELITEELLDDNLCMNLGPGGHGGWMNNPNSLTPLRDPENRKKVGQLAGATIKKCRESIEYRTAYASKLSVASEGNQNFLGKNHSEETKNKMSESHRGKHSGEKNSQFGTCWVNDGVRPVKIKKEQLSEFLIKGWTRGRKI